MSIEAQINYQLNKYPVVKKVVKRAYQRTMYAISPKIKSEGNIIRVSLDDKSHEYFFGYYDKSPWDATDRYMLCLKAKDTWSDVSPKEAAKIILIDTERDNHVTVLAETRSWNVQQGCMLQWLGPDFRNRILFNDFREGQYCSVVLKLNYEDNRVSAIEEKVVPSSVYSVSADGTFALTLDFSRLYRLRPGYGYYNVPENTAGEKLPDKPCIWYVDLVNGCVKSVLKYTDFASFHPRPEMNGAEHKVNHIMLSPNGKRFMVLHRWFAGQRKYTRLVTCNIDGTDMYVLSDDDMVSHCCWRNNQQIFAFENKKEGQKGDKAGSGYYLMKDKTQEYRRFWPGIDYDGHPSYSPDGSMVVFDRYPDRARMASIMLCNSKNRRDSGVKTIAKVFAPFKYDNDTRCDLHPRWNRKGDKICFDSVFEGHRGLYVLDVSDNGKREIEFVGDGIKTENNEIAVDRAGDGEMDALFNYSGKKRHPLISVIVPVYNVERYLKRCVDSIAVQTYSNLEIILVDDGSTDNSGTICDEIAQQDKRIRVMHKRNGGLSSARNSGLKMAAGDFISFVDSDDWIDEDIYSKCIKAVNIQGADVVDFKPVFASATENIVKQYSKSGCEIICGEEILYDYLYKGQMEICPFSVCRKLYKRELFSDINFPAGKVNEDIATNFKVLSNANKLVRIQSVGYYYFTRNEGSITSGKLKKRDFDLLDACKELITLSLECKDKRIKKLAEIKLARSYFSLLAKAATSGIAEEVSKEDIRLLTKNLRKNYRTLMQSQMPVNRKLLTTSACIDYRTISVPYTAVKVIRGGYSEKPLISVIVPIYKAENYLIRCVDSIRNQTYTNLEIILVVDGSPDSCGFICDEIAKRDKRIVVIRKENGGLSSARNAGMEVATGELIAFVDSDDWLKLNTYEYCIRKLKETEADAIQYGYAVVRRPTTVRQLSEKLEIYDGNDILQNYMRTTTKTGSYSVWRIIFCRETVENLKFREGKINEDIDFKYRALSRCNRYVATNQIMYYYFQSGDTLSTGGLKKRDFDLYDAADELRELTKNEKYGEISYLGKVKAARTAFSLLSKIAYYGVADPELNKDLLVKGLMAELRENVGVLMRSPISISRKMLALMFAINFGVTEKCVHFARWLPNRR